MLYLSKKHDPIKNETLLSKWFETNHTLKDSIEETSQLFKSFLNQQSTLRKLPVHSRKPTKFLIPRLLLTTKKQPPLINAPTYQFEEGKPYPEWKTLLDQEYTRLNNKIDSHVNVLTFGAVGDGKTDNTHAFKKAIGNGKRMVYIPEGVYITQGIKLPSWTCFIGEGKGKTVIKLANDAPKKARLLTNAHHIRGNHHIVVQGMTLDWNVERLDANENTSAGNNQSSCLTYAHVKYGWVRDVEAINPGLHSFDVSAAYYTYFGDGTRSRWPSKYIWLDHLNGYGFGDDGVTTHHSSHILITNSHMCDPSGRSHKKGFSNSNGFEVDDGSHDVWLMNNSSTRCFGGVEIKAHDTASAAANVHIIGHISVNDNRSYNFRHIGHHQEGDPESQSAFNITATNIISIAPVFTDLYKNSTPRCLVVSAYQNVVINHFVMIGDPEYDYQNNPMISLQYRSRNICLNHVTSKNFKTAGTDIKVVGGSQHTENISLRKISIHHSAPQAIEVGKGIESISISDVEAIVDKGIYALKSAQNLEHLYNIQASGYRAPIMLAGEVKQNITRQLT